MDQDLLVILKQGFSAIHERLAKMDERFDAMDERFDAMGKRSDAMDQRFDAMDQRFDAMDQRFDAMGQRSDAMDQRFDTMGKRSDAMEERFAAMEARVTQQIQELRQETAGRFEQMGHHFENLEGEVRGVYIVVEGLDDKIQLAAEVITNVNEKLDRHRDEVSQRFNDLESLVSSSDRALASRVNNLEQKVKLAS